LIVNENINNGLFSMPIICGDALEELRKLPANSINLIYTDPPYFKVKGEAWDHQWGTPALFLDWIGQLCQEWQRVLKPNGSLYVFASPKMAARVECEIGKYFNILNRITWRKNDGTANEGGLWSRANKDILRRFFEQKEELIFAEHFGSDNIAKGEAGYGAKCDELRGFIFEPIRAYLDGEKERAGFTTRQVAEAFQKKTGSRTVTGMAGHWFTSVQWTLPTWDNYLWLRELLNFGKVPEYLKRDYEDLKRDYEDLRRPFQVTAQVPCTDVWDFPTVQFYRGKHPCEKPLDMHRHVITASSKPGDVVLDCFGGSCQVADVCKGLGREYIIIEKDLDYVNIANRRLQTTQTILS